MTIELALLSGVACRGQEITGPRLRGLLALLAADLRTGCSTGRLVDELWPDEQPANPTKALQVLVSRLRSQFGADLIVSAPAGYRLGLGEEQVDSSAIGLHATASARSARGGDASAALAAAERGLELWDGKVGDEPTLDDPVSELRAERVSTHRALVRARALALSRLGRHAEAMESLTALAGEHPRDEEIRLELLRSEAATAGPSEALAGYEDYRRSLRDDLGTDPGPALQALQQELLRGESPEIRQGVPHEPNRLLGRTDDIAAVARLIRTSRVTSIVGPGGLGKTRLANVVAREAPQRVVYLVALAGVTSDEDVTGEVGSALGAGDAWRGYRFSVDAVRGIVDVLGHASVLLVLDNCEQVVDGVAELVQALVSMTANVCVLTTSRTPLGLSSESVYLLPELDLSTSVELFEQRARAARPGVELPRAAVRDLCEHLDGLPLAVELAAARVRVLSVAEIARRLSDRFALLRGGGRDVPERHQTLRAVVDWSWNLLEPDGRTAMRALSLFTAGFTAEAAEYLLPGHDVLPLLEQLVDQSLLKAADTDTGLRFRMLETVREFGAVQLEAAGEVEQAVGGLLAWARAFGRAHHDTLYQPEPYAAISRVRAEQDNLNLALRLALARGDGASTAASAAALITVITAEGNYVRMGALYEECSWLLSHYRPEPDYVEPTRSLLTFTTVFTLLLLGPRATRAQVALRRLPPAEPGTMAAAAGVLLDVSPDDLAELDRLSTGDAPLLAAGAAALLSYFWEGKGDLDQALVAAQRLLHALRSQQMPWLEAMAHTRISELALQTETSVDVRYHLVTALPVLEKLGAVADAEGIKWWLVLANIQLGAFDEAERWMARAFHTRVDDPSCAMPEEAFGTYDYDLAVRAQLLLARGEVEAGLRLWRRVVDRLSWSTNQEPYVQAIGVDPWALEAAAVTVVAHGQHDRLELVESVVAELPGRLTEMLADPVSNPPPHLMQGPIWGTLLLATAIVALDRGSRTDDPAVTAAGVRMIALAERLRYLRYFRPTMEPRRIRQLALDTARPAYEEAVSSYAGLDREGLRLAALDLLGATALS
ncbi:ATP-binding protein [Flindersiella endophytica]